MRFTDSRASFYSSKMNIAYERVSGMSNSTTDNRLGVHYFMQGLKNNDYKQYVASRNTWNIRYFKVRPVRHTCQFVASVACPKMLRAASFDRFIERLKS